MLETIKKELDSLYELSLAEQTSRIVDKLSGMGITPIENSTARTINKAYTVGDYALVDIQPVYFPERRTPCIIDKDIYDEVGRCHFRNEVRDRRIWDGYHLEPKITISGNGLERDNYKIYRYILKAPKKVPVESQVFIVGNLPNDILQEIAKTVAGGKVYDFTEFKYQDAKETCDVSLKSVKPWSSEHTFVPINIQEMLNRASSPVLMIPTCFSGVQQCFEPMGMLEEVDEDAEE